MSTEEAGFGANRRTPRQGVGGSPVGSWLSIALAVIALIVGFLILRNITDDGSSSSSVTGGDPAETTTGAEGEVDGTLPLVPEVPQTTEAPAPTTLPLVTDGASVLVANANTVGGSAGNMSKTLELRGYTVEDPVNASGDNIEASIVYYEGSIAGAQAVAESVARDLGGVEVSVVASPAPTVSGDLGDAGVLVLLGDNEAGRTIEELSGASEDGDAAVAAPEPAGGDVPVTAPADADTGGDDETETTDG